MSAKIPDGGFQAELEGEWQKMGNAFLPFLFAISLLGALIVVGVHWGVAPMDRLLGWTILFLMLAVARAVVLHVSISRKDVPRASFYVMWYWLSMAAACVWGLAIWLFFDYGGVTERLILCITVYCFCILNSQSVPPHDSSFHAYLALCWVPLVGRLSLLGGTRNVLLAFTAGFMLVAVAFVFRRFFGGFKARGEALLWQLQSEKAAADEARQAADAARHEAEIANRSKTQFLAAASHDLRQPLHAVGLLAEALRQRSHDEEGAQLVSSINGAVDALEELFSELLDITKVDSGSLAANPEHFAAETVFRRVRLHFEPVAFEKGLALRFRGGHYLLHADPVLVERILRNLVSNALRYTNDGTVLVSCRRRRDHVLLQVSDTGVGIPAAERQRIFEEFYQVPGIESSGPQQRRGLGLGLSIAQRFAKLMQTPLTVYSEPGHGSVFSLELPPGDAREAEAVRPAPSPVAPPRTLDGRSIVVVDDEPAVRAGLEALLSGWGAEVIAFDSVHASKAWVEQAGPDADDPDLLIVDYRLEGEHNGLEVIHALRERFGERLPVIMVTGSVMSDLGSTAREQGFQVLLKPVAPHKLRALVNFALTQR